MARFQITCIAICLGLYAHADAHANWQLVNAESQLTFISTKAGDLAEIHRFSKLAGTITDSGAVRIVIDLASVDTLIPIRDERMRSMLFDLVSFPTALITAQVEAATMEALPAGATTTLRANATLALQGATHRLPLDLMVAKLAADRVLVLSAKPIVVSAAVLGLAEGVERLREIAGLPSISQAVPVSFHLLFSR